MSDESMLVKVVVIGDANVGKSCLILRYSENRFVHSYLATMGSDFTIKLAQVKDFGVRLAIWDLGGQKMFQSMRKYYLQGAAGAIIVYDVTEPNSFKNIEKWVKELNRFSGEVPTIVLGNKVDLMDERQIITKTGKSKAKKLGFNFFETSAKTGSNVQKAFNALAELIYADLKV